MNIFKTIKEAVSTRDVATFYGIKVGRTGMCCCPFHNDTHPSMKVDNRYHCFGCGADGDVINFVSELYNLSPYKAALKLSNDFHIDISKDKTPPTSTTPAGNIIPNTSTSGINNYPLQRAFQLYKRDALLLLHGYLDFLCKAMRNYAPPNASELENCHPDFEEALNNIDFINWLIDELTFGDDSQQLELLTSYGGKIDYVKKRLSELK